MWARQNKLSGTDKLRVKMIMKKEDESYLPMLSVAVAHTHTHTHIGVIVLH